MSEASRPVAGVVVAHGSMADGLVSAAERIAGVAGALVPLSNEGRGPGELASALDELLEEGPTVVFTDLRAGSCALSALAASRRGDVAVVCGANLPMLLDFLFHRDLGLETLVPRLVDKGREGIWTPDPDDAA